MAVCTYISFLFLREDLKWEWFSTHLEWRTLNNENDLVSVRETIGGLNT